MAAISTQCPSCTASLTFPEKTKPGSRGRCPRCGRSVAVPSPREETHTAIAGDGSRHEPTPAPHPTEEDSSFLEAAQAPDEIGRLGPYRILGRLGAGGMGIVYEADDTRLRRHIALKVMLPEHAASKAARSRFLREARAQAAVEHDHVASIFVVGEEKKVPYIAMPLLKGQTLAAALQENPNPPVAEVLRIGREAAEGLAAAHASGLIHRDIKPGNIWLEGKKRRVKILDFGLARAVDDDTDDSEGKTRKGLIVGTPAYMSPEQAQGLEVDARSDLWSLGIVLYQLATGFLPFRGSTALATLMAIASESVAPPIQFNEAIPKELNDLILLLLTRDPANRPANASDVAGQMGQLEQANRTATLQTPASGPWASLDFNEPGEVVHTSTKTLTSHTPVVPDTAPRASRKKWLLLGSALAALAVAAGIYFGSGDNPPVVKSPPPSIPGNGKQGSPPPGLGTKPRPVPINPYLNTAWQLVPPGQSPLDKLDPAAIPSKERHAWQPRELVAIVGTHERRHWYEISGLAWSPDGRWIASSAGDVDLNKSGENGISLWDAATRRLVRQIELPEKARARCHAFTPDSKRLAIATKKAIWLYDLTASSPGSINWCGPGGPQSLTYPDIEALKFSADGKLLVIAKKSKPSLLRVLDLATSTPAERIRVSTGDHPYSKNPFDLTPDGQTLVYCAAASEGHPNRVVVLDISGPATNVKSTLDLGSVLPTGCALSPDGRTLAVCRYTGQSVTLLDMTANPPVEKLSLPCRMSESNTLQFSPRGGWIWCGRTGSCNLLKVPSDNKPQPPFVLNLTGDTCAFAPDDSKVVCEHKDNGLMRYYDLTGASPVEIDATPTQAHFLPKGTQGPVPEGLVYSRGLLRIERQGANEQLWDLNGPSPRPWLDPVQSEIREAKFSRDGAHAVARFPLKGAGKFRLLDWTPTGYREVLPLGDAGFLASRNGLAVARLRPENSYLSLWDMNTPPASARSIGILPSTPDLKRHYLDPTGKFVIYATEDIPSLTNKRFEIWNISGQVPAKYASIPGAPSRFTFSVDGRWLVAMRSDQAPDLYDLRGKEIYRSPFPLVDWRNGPHAAAITPDNRCLIVAGTKRLEIWELHSGKKVWSATLPGRIGQVEVAPDGRHILTFNGNGTVYILRFSGLADPGGPRFDTPTTTNAEEPLFEHAPMPRLIGP